MKTAANHIATTIDTVRVEWPSGPLQELHDVVPRPFLTITEPYCAGDCSNQGHVTVDELLTRVNIALGDVPGAACPHGVPSDADVTVALVVRAVNDGLNGCGR